MLPEPSVCLGAVAVAETGCRANGVGVRDTRARLKEQRLYGAP